MTMDAPQTDQPQLPSTTNAKTSRKMDGWIKLAETIRQTKPASTAPSRPFSNSTSNHHSVRQIATATSNSSFSLPSNTNGHTFKSPVPTNTAYSFDSPQNIFTSPSIVSIGSTPRQTLEDIYAFETESLSTPSLRRDDRPSVDTELTTTPFSSPTLTDSQSYGSPSRKNTVRKSRKMSQTKPPEISRPITEDISDDDMPLVDIRKQKKKSIDTLSIPSNHDSIIPLATDLQSLPGHSRDEIRDSRFLNYIDLETLFLHFDTCLHVDPNYKKYTFKPGHNIWNKILKIYYLKTFPKHLCLEKRSFLNKKDHQKSQPLSVISSPTAASFKTDWSVTRRNPSSTHRHGPKNPFHVLQLNPQMRFPSTASPFSSTLLPSRSSIQNFETIKDVLARTYYPHLYTAVEYGYQFGFQSRFPNTQQLVATHEDIKPIKERPESPDVEDDAITITLKSPPFSARSDSSMATDKSKNEEKSSSSISIDRRLSGEIEELSPWIIKESVVVLTPTRFPTQTVSSLPSPTSIEKGKKVNLNRKRKSSAVSVIERKKTKFIPSPSPEVISQIEDISEPESVEETAVVQVPRQSPIKNGLRSQDCKKTTDSNSTNDKTRADRRQQRSSVSSPTSHNGVFECDDKRSSTVDDSPPYDTQQLGQQKDKSTEEDQYPLSHPSPIPSTFQHQKKKSNKPKQKQPQPFKKIFRNQYSEQLRQNSLSSYTTNKAPVCECKPPETCEDGFCLNKMIYTECLPSCVCGAKCSNQKIRKSQWFKHLDVFDTSKYGQGLRTTSSLAKGTFICEYVGEIITDEQFHDRMTNLYSKDEHHYTMKLTQNLVIDAYRMGSKARFANHSCAPNCEFQKWTVDGLQRMCMFSLRHIKAGEELTYDYNFQCFNLQAQQPCYCESSKCRGTIGAKQQIVSPTANNSHSPTTTMSQRLTQREKRIVSQSSIFLLRNLRRIKERQLTRKKTNDNKLKQHSDKLSSIPLFFTQNYYHSTGSPSKSTLASLRKTPKLAHKEIFYLYYNHIRRSHFAKSGRHHHELIDPTCYYAQLAQLTLILNEFFDSIVTYKCVTEDITPSQAIKKCPSKRLFPVYYEIIAKPIDLTMIRHKLDNGEYLSFDLFKQDLSLLLQNAKTYCGEETDAGQAILELQDYFENVLTVTYANQLMLFENIKEENQTLTNLHTFEHFIGRLHEKEVIDGQIRETLYEIIHSIDSPSEDDSPIVYKIVLANGHNSHRPSKSRTSSDCIVHCRCGSVHDDISLVQCYACQLWQHVACVSIVDSSRPYYCFECQPTCEDNPSACLKSNVMIAATLSPLQTYDDNHSSYSTLTRSDGFVIRTNESYFVPKQDKKNIDRSLTSPEYDILFIERLWFDDFGIGQASGFYYIRPNETFHEPNRKFFANEVFRFPPSNDPLPISSIVRPCFVLDLGKYCKGKPISDNSSRVSLSDIFICDFRVDKLARTFTRLLKSRHFGINCKSYCFDNYVEKLSLKRDYQPYQKEVQQQQLNENRRRPYANRKLHKQHEEKCTRINGLIEKIYRRHHHPSAMPREKTYTVEQLQQQWSLLSTPKNGDDLRHPSPSKEKKRTSSSVVRISAGHITKKRRTISLSSDDDIVEVVAKTDEQRSSKKRSTKSKTSSASKRDKIS